MLNTVSMLNQEKKTCTRCGQEKNLSEFRTRVRNGKRVYYSRCKECMRELNTEYRRSKGIMPARKQTEDQKKRGVRTCTKCNIEKPEEEFGWHNKQKKIRHSWCKECMSTYSKERYNNPKIKAHMEEVSKKYRAQNREIINEKNRQYYESHKEAVLKRIKEYRSTEQGREKRNNYLNSYRKRPYVVAKRKEYLSRPETKEILAQFRQKPEQQARRKHWREEHREELKAYMAEYGPEYYQKNKELINKIHKEYREKNKEKLKEYYKQYNRENAELISQRGKEWYEKNKEKRIAKQVAYHKEKRATDPLFKFKEQVRFLIADSFRRKSYVKHDYTKDLVGLDWSEFYTYMLETWKNNYGTEWNGEPYHIDHIIPLATAETEEDVIKLCHYSNLQMLKPEDNISKKDKLDWELPNKNK